MKIEAQVDPNQKILLNATAILVLAILLSAFFADYKFTLGLVIGGVLTFVNYYWLKSSLKKLFDEIMLKGTRPIFPASKYLLRYATLGILIYLIHRFELASVTAVLIGLCMFAAGTLLEGFILILKTFTTKEEKNVSISRR